MVDPLSMKQSYACEVFYMLNVTRQTLYLWMNYDFVLFLVFIDKP